MDKTTINIVVDCTGDGQIFARIGDAAPPGDLSAPHAILKAIVEIPGYIVADRTGKRFLMVADLGGTDWCYRPEDALRFARAVDAARFSSGADGWFVVPFGPAPPPAEAEAIALGMRTALRTALGHIEHMAAFIGRQEAGYSFESLGEDKPGMDAALAAGERL